MSRPVVLVVAALAAGALVLWLSPVSLAALVPRTPASWLVVGAIVVVLVAWSRLAVPRLTHRPRVRTALRVVPVLLLASAVLLPAIVDRQVSESLLEGVPTAAAGAATDSPEAAPGAASSGPAAGGTGPTAAAPNPAPPPEPERLSSGIVRGVGHEAEGTALVYRAGDSEFVRLEFVDVQGAVDVFVWLVPGADQTTPDGGVDLGELKGTRGEANYVVPADVDVADYRTVLLWCRAFSTPIAVAPQS